VRAMGIDHGERRIGVAISDETKTLARPFAVLQPGSSQGALDEIARLIARTAADEGSLDLIVVGLPARLDGTPNEATARVTAFVNALARRTSIPIVTQDERLSSREAESRLAPFRKGWRERKALLDAASAAIILQDYLDRTKK